MKKTFLFIVTLLLTVTITSHAQQPVVDKYPEATIYIIDPQSGQEVLGQDDNAILFKDAFIDLVNNTYRVKHIIKSPGHKSIVITQTDPADGNAFQLVNQSKFLGSEIANYTFSYSVDQNTLYYLDPVSQTWQPELVQGYNVVNLNSCLALGKFNELQPAYADSNGNNDVQQTGDDNSDENLTADAPPPALQDYEQPECPEDGYLWQPGYWAFSPGGGYYWVHGVWVAPPSEGLLWTPPYWGYEGNVYVFHSGYWGPHVGYYGGINYGYGYAGDGYYGGNWYGGHFRYNTAVVRVNTTVVHNVYVDRTVIVNNTTVNNRTSFNGPGGTNNRPTQREIGVAHENHIRDFHQDPNAANRVNAYHNNNGGNNQGNNGYRNGNNFRNNNNQPAGNNSNTNNTTNNNTTGSNNGHAYIPRNGSAPGNNNGDRNGNVYMPRNGSTPNSNSSNNNNQGNSNTQNTPNSYAPSGVRSNGNIPSVPSNGPGRPSTTGNNPGTPRAPGSSPSVPRGPGGHNSNGGGGNYMPRNNNGNGNNNGGGQGKNGGRDRGNDKSSNSGKKDDKKGGN